MREPWKSRTILLASREGCERTEREGAWEDLVTRRAETTPPNPPFARGGKRRNETGMEAQLVQDQLFTSPAWLSISWTSRPCDWEGNRPGDHEPRSWRATSVRDTSTKLARDPFRGLLTALDALGHADSVIGVAGKRQTGMLGNP